MSGGYARRAFTPEMEEKAVAGARRGYSFETIAHSIGHSLKSLALHRKTAPEFNSRLLSALSEYDMALTEQIDAEADPAMRKMLADQQARRFPHRYGNDPRFRVASGLLDAERDVEDVEQAETSVTAGEQLAAAINAVLSEREGPSE